MFLGLNFGTPYKINIVRLIRDTTNIKLKIAQDNIHIAIIERIKLMVYAMFEGLVNTIPFFLKNKLLCGGLEKYQFIDGNILRGLNE